MDRETRLLLVFFAVCVAFIVASCHEEEKEAFSEKEACIQRGGTPRFFYKGGMVCFSKDALK